MKKKGLILMLAFLMVFASAVIPSKCTFAKSKTGWYGKYSETAQEAKKAIKFKGDKITLKGKFTFTKGRHAWDAKENKINKTFKLTKNTKYLIDDTNAEKDPIKKVSKKEFKEWAHSDITHCAFKVQKGKIVKAVVSLN